MSEQAKIQLAQARKQMGGAGGRLPSDTPQAAEAVQARLDGAVTTWAVAMYLQARLDEALRDVETLREQARVREGEAEAAAEQVSGGGHTC